MTNNKAVTNAPLQTMYHLILASGRILNINANKRVITNNEAKKLTILNSQIMDSDQCTLIQLPTAANKVVMTMEINSKKAMEIIRPKENKRVLTYIQTPDLAVVAFTSQMMLSDFCNCTNTPVAPIRMVAIPRMVAQMESRPRKATMIISWIWSAVSFPNALEIVLCNSVWTNSAPKK